jgi:hypothetical protein
MSGMTAALNVEGLLRRPTVDADRIRQRLTVALATAWSAETCFDPTAWTEALPEAGQCAVTALIVQDVLGGVIVRAQVHGASHYWNVMDDGSELDLTRGQFRSWPAPAPELVRRGYLLSNSDTVRRYRLLSHRIGLVAAR